MLPCGAHPSDFDSVSLERGGSGVGGPTSYACGCWRAIHSAPGSRLQPLGTRRECGQRVFDHLPPALPRLGWFRSTSNPVKPRMAARGRNPSRAERASPACCKGNSKFYYERLERQTRGATRWGHRRETEAEGGGHGPRSVRLRTQREALWALDPLGRGGRVSRKNIPENCCILGRKTSSAHAGSPTGRRLPGRGDGRLLLGSPRGRASVCVCLRPHLRFPEGRWSLVTSLELNRFCKGPLCR